jgi:hypothetical protein
MNFIYSEIFNFVYEKLRAAYGWTVQILSESIYSNLISAFSYGVEQLAFYDEILTKESVYKTAELTSSINYISWMLNYTSHRKIGASSIAYVSADPSFNLRSGEYTYTNLSTVIPKWTPISGTSVNAYAVEDVTIPSNTTVYHYNLPVNLTEQRPRILVITDEGIAIIPVTVSNLSQYINSPSQEQLTQDRKIPVGSYVNIKGSVYFSGEYRVVSIPTTYSSNYSSNYNIAIQTNYYAQSGLNEEIQLGTILSVGQIRVQIREGNPLEYLYISTGSINERIPIFSPNVDNDIYEVYIVTTSEQTLNGVTTYSTSIIDTVTVLKTDAYLVNDLTKYYCTIYNDPEFKYIYFEFGDDVKTKKLSAGQNVLIKYAETVGELGNTSSLDVIDSFDVNLVSANGIPVTGLYITNVSSFIGGSDYETPESIKFNSRSQFNESNLLISNWTPIINKHPSILKSRVWTQVDINPYYPNLNLQNNVYISALNKAGKPILSGSIDANNIIYLYLRKYSSPTDVIVFQDTYIIQVKATIYYKIKPTNTTLFFNTVLQNLKNKYDIYNVDYITPIFASNVVKIVENSSEDVIYARVSLSYLESSTTNRYFYNGSPAIYLTATFKNSVLSKDAFLKPSAETLSLWIRRKISGTYQKWIKIGQQVVNNLKFDTSTISNYTNRVLSIHNDFIDPNSFLEVGNVAYSFESGNITYYRKATSVEEDDSDKTKFYFVQSYNNSTSRWTLIEAGPIRVTGLQSIDTVNLPNPFDLKDVSTNLAFVNGKSYFLDSNGNFTSIRGSITRKFTIRKTSANSDIVSPNNAIIPKGFYFDDCLITNQGLYNTITTDVPKFYNFISGFDIEAITNQLVPNSNQIVYNTQNNTSYPDISYTTQFNYTLSNLISEQDLLNPEDSQLKGYELRIIYNTVERDDAIAPTYTNDIRLPYNTNILDVQSENIDFVEE